MDEKFQIQTNFLKHLSPDPFLSLKFKTLEAMSSPNSPTLDKVIKNIMENVQGDRVEQPENQETTHAEEVKEEDKKMEGDAGGARVFLIDKGAEIFKNTITKK